MAHEISIVNVNGQSIVEAMYANQPAWHGLGTIFDPTGLTAPDSATALELAHLNWRVLLEPLYLQDGREVPGFYATVREDTKATLGVVSDRYKVIQNLEAFEFLDGLLQDGIMRYESAMALKGGRIITLLARMPSVDTVAEGDKGLRYIMFSTSHDGTASIHCLPTWVRVVCANTQRLAIRTGKALDFTIRHTGDVQAKLNQARQYLSQFDEQFTLFRDKARLLATRKVDAADVPTYLAQLFPKPEEGESDAGRERMLSEMTMAMFHPNQQIGAIRGTWWALYNALTQVIDHKDLSGRGHVTAQRENRFLNVTDGPGAALKDKAFGLACEMAGVNAA